jgi:hypothetical protein
MRPSQGANEPPIQLLNQLQRQPLPRRLATSLPQRSCCTPDPRRRCLKNSLKSSEVQSATHRRSSLPTKTPGHRSTLTFASSLCSRFNVDRCLGNRVTTTIPDRARSLTWGPPPRCKAKPPPRPHPAALQGHRFRPYSLDAHLTDEPWNSLRIGLMPESLVYRADLAPATAAHRRPRATPAAYTCTDRAHDDCQLGGPIAAKAARSA